MPGDTAHRIRTALSLLEPRALAARPFSCPMCGPSLLVRLSAQPIGVRCVRCAGSAITLALVTVLKAVRPGFRGEALYELSARGPLYEFLRREVPRLTVSEYFEGTPAGARRGRAQELEHRGIGLGDPTLRIDQQDPDVFVIEERLEDAVMRNTRRAAARLHWRFSGAPSMAARV